jgi:hypothetical protein
VQLAREVSLSPSFLAKIERGVANHDFSRDQVWNLIRATKVPPVDCERLLENSGHRAERTIDEELQLQKNLPPGSAIWVFCRSLLTDYLWAEAVAANIRNGITYSFFTSDGDSFGLMLASILFGLTMSAGDEAQARSTCERHMRGYVLPEEFFPTNFFIYNPGRPSMYSVGTRVFRAEPIACFNNNAIESEFLYQMTTKIIVASALDGGLKLRPIQCVYPGRATQAPIASTPVAPFALDTPKQYADSLLAARHFILNPPDGK